MASSIELRKWRERTARDPYVRQAIGAAIAKGVAQVASDHVREPARVTRQERILEAHEPAVFAPLGGRGRALAQSAVALECQRVPWCRANQRKGDEGDSEKCRDGSQDPLEQRRPHGGASQTSSRSYQTTEGRMPRTRLLTASREGRL